MLSSGQLHYTARTIQLIGTRSTNAPYINRFHCYTVTGVSLTGVFERSASLFINAPFPIHARPRKRCLRERVETPSSTSDGIDRWNGANGKEVTAQRLKQMSIT